MSKEVVAKLIGVSKEYKSGDSIITALNTTSLSIYKNELTLIIGPSGSGKTTLLSMLGCVIYPTKGEVEIAGQSTKGLKQKALSKLRLEYIGFVFQSFNLVQPLNALENVILPLELLGVNKKEAKEKATKVLTNIGLADRLKSLPKMLSGGQQQRVAIARALITNPSMILCDEPTASLDVHSIGNIMDDLKKLSTNGKAVVIVTHDERLKQYADRIIHVIDGKVIEDDTKQFFETL